MPSLPAILLLLALAADGPAPPAPDLIDHPGAKPHADLSDILIQSSLDYRTGQANRTLILQAMLHLPESFDAIGMSHQIDITELVDGTGRDLLAPSLRKNQIVFSGPRHYGALNHRRNRQLGGPIAVSNSVSGLPEVPPSFRTIKGRAWLLVATARVTREVTPIRIGSLVELVPALAVQVVQLKQEGENLELHFRYDATNEAPFFNPNIEPPVVDAVKLIDDRGGETPGRGGAPQQLENDNGIFEGEGRLVFTLPEGRKPVGLRFHVVTEMEEREVAFESRDVKMPVAEEELVDR